MRVITPFGAGGALDLTARSVGVKMQEAMKQNIVVDNRPGVGGAISADLVAKAVADGYMVLLASPAELAKFVKDESDKFAKLIKASGAKGSD